MVRRIAAGLSEEDYVDVSDEEDEDSYVDFLLEESSDTYRYSQSQSGGANGTDRPSRPSCDVGPSLPICNDCSLSGIIADRRQSTTAAIAAPSTSQQARIDVAVRNISSSPRTIVDPRLIDRTTWGNCRFCHRFLRSSIEFSLNCQHTSRFCNGCIAVWRSRTDNINRNMYPCMCKPFRLQNVDFATAYLHREYRMLGGPATEMETLYFYQYRERYGDVLRYCLENNIQYSIPAPRSVPDMLNLVPAPSTRRERDVLARRNRPSTPYRRSAEQ